MQRKIIIEDLKYITSASLPWKELEGKNILISGAGGFLGSYMVEALLFLNNTEFRKKAKVFAVVRDYKKARERFGKYNSNSGLRLILQDICEPVKIKDRVHFIIHAASYASPHYYGKDPVGTLLPNITGTVNLLNLARKKNVESFLFFSSSEVYGRLVGKNIPIKEDSYGYLNPLELRSSYAESKRMAETMCFSWFKQYSVPVKIVRPFHTYGPGISLDDSRVYAGFVNDILNNRNIHIESDGKAIRSFCYVADAVLAFFWIMLKGKNGQAYNVGNKRGEISIMGLANLLTKLFKDKSLKVKRRRPLNASYIKSKVSFQVPDTSKIAKLGWKPRYSLEEGFMRTVRSFMDE